MKVLVRLVMSNTKSDFTGTETESEYYFFRGDLLIKNKDAADSTFVWASTDGTSYPISAARPTEGAALTLVQDNEVALIPFQQAKGNHFGMNGRWKCTKRTAPLPMLER